jgi:hypothetical protein
MVSFFGAFLNLFFHWGGLFGFDLSGVIQPIGDQSGVIHPIG